MYLIFTYFLFIVFDWFVWLAVCFIPSRDYISQLSTINYANLNSSSIIMIFFINKVLDGSSLHKAYE